MERRLVAFDLDGTLLDERKRPLPSTVDAINQLKEAGHIVTIATGRNRLLAKGVIEELAFDYAVMCNGSVAMANGEIFYERRLDEEEFAHLHKSLLAKKIDLAVVGLDATHRLTTFNEESMEEAMSSFGSVTPQLDQEFLKTSAVYQGLAYFDEKEAYDTAVYEYLDFVRWHPQCVDVIPKGGSKAFTLLLMAEKLGIKRENVLAFGDGLNDREMLREVGVGIAMGNAVDEVKICADIVTDTNMNDGIAKALKELYLIK